MPLDILKSEWVVRRHLTFYLDPYFPGLYLCRYLLVHVIMYSFFWFRDGSFVCEKGWRYSTFGPWINSSSYRTAHLQSFHCYPHLLPSRKERETHNNQLILSRHSFSSINFNFQSRPSVEFCSLSWLIPVKPSSNFYCKSCDHTLSLDSVHSECQKRNQVYSVGQSFPILVWSPALNCSVLLFQKARSSQRWATTFPFSTLDLSNIYYLYWVMHFNPSTSTIFIHSIQF